jgi:hypothetical protein
MPPPDIPRKAHALDAPIAFSTERIKLGEPLPDAVYKTANAVLQAYRDHAYNRGYRVVLEYYAHKNKEGQKTIYMCDRGGKPRDQKNPDLHDSKKRPNVGTRKTNCPFRVVAQEQQDSR